MIAPDPEFIANGRLPSPSPSVFPVPTRIHEVTSSPVAATVTTAALLDTDSAIDALCPFVMTVAASVIVTVIDSVSGVTPSVALTVSV